MYMHVYTEKACFIWVPLYLIILTDYEAFQGSVLKKKIQMEQTGTSW